MIYLLTAIGLSPGGRSTVHIYTQTIRRTIQNKQYIEQHNNFGCLHILTSTRRLIRMHEKYHKNTACTSLPEDDHLVVRNMLKTL